MLDRIHICGLEEAIEELEERPDRYTHVVSIGAPRDPHPLRTGEFKGDAIRLVFDDVEVEFLGYEAPNRQHIRDLISFFQPIRDRDRVLIHCFQGVSRSTAAGIILLYLKGENDVKAFYKAYPDAEPNRRMLRLADEILEANGERSIRWSKRRRR